MKLKRAIFEVLYRETLKIAPPWIEVDGFDPGADRRHWKTASARAHFGCGGILPLSGRPRVRMSWTTRRASGYWIPQ